MAMADGVEDATVHMQARKYSQKKKQKIAYYITIEREKDLKKLGGSIQIQHSRG